MNVKLTQPTNAPNFCFELVADDGQTSFIQSDWDYPSIAANFGFRPCEQCNATDGTVDCQHKKASDMIAQAFDYLVERVGQSFDDQDYFLGS